MSDQCPHGFMKKASCVLCMEDGPVAPITPDASQVLKAELIVVARYEGFCARKRCTISYGDSIGYVSDVGWCCSDCAR